MKNLKRALAVIIALTMVMSTVAFAGVFSDVEDSAAYAEAVELGVALKLFTGYEDGSFKPSGDITRAEFAAVVVRMLGMESSAEGAKGTTKFTDVPSTHWASGYVNIASSNKIVNGYGDGKFGPEDNVTYEQAVKMLVVALGYEPAAAGNYPVGYLTIAQQRGVTTGVRGTNGVAANRGQVALMVFNALDVPMMEQTGFGTYIDYVVNDGAGDTYRKTVLTEKLGVVKLRVTVTKSYEFENTKKSNVVRVKVTNPYNSKYADDDYDDDKIFARDKETDVIVGSTNLKSFVGSQVNLYIAYDESSDDDPVALYAKRYIAGSDEVAIIGDNIDSTSLSGDVLTVSYYENDSATRTTKLTIKNVTDRIYVNGNQVKSSNVATQINNVYGMVTFSRELSTTEEDYDTVFITHYQNMVVEDVNMTSGRVNGKEGLTAIIFKDTNTDNSSTLIDIDGKPLEWSSLKENDVLSVQRVVNNGRTVSVCTLVNKTITGRVSEYNNQDDEYTIGGNVYKLDTQLITDLRLDDEGTFYLDILGRIVYFDKTKSATGNYAIILEAAEDTGLDRCVKAKLFTYEGEVVTFDLAQTVTVEYENASGVYTSTSGIKAETLVDSKPEDENDTKDPKILASNRVITFAVNSSGKISKISFPKSTNDDKNFSLYAEATGTTTSSYDSERSAFDVGSSRVYVDSSTKVLKAPKVVYKTATSSYDYNTDLYELIAIDSLVGEYFGMTNVSAYDVDKDRNAGLVLVQSNYSFTSGANGVVMVISTSKSKNSQGYEVEKATVLQNANKFDLKAIDITAAENVALGIKNSDVITTSINGKGEVTEVTKLAEVITGTVSETVEGVTKTYSRQIFSPVKETGEAKTNIELANDNKLTEKVEYSYGKVIERSSNRLTVQTASGNKDFTIPAKANVYAYEQKGTRNATKVYAPIDRLGVFSIDRSGKTFDADGDTLEDVYVLIREYDRDIADVILYLFQPKVLVP